MDYILLIASILIFSIQTICFKYFNRSFMKNKASFFLFNTIYYAIIILVLLVVNPETIVSVQTITVVLAVIFGIVFLMTILWYMKAMEIGPLSISALILSFGILIPIVVGVLFWNESISVCQAIALPLLFITFYLGSQVKENASIKINIKWIMYIVLAMLGNGAVLTLLKIHQKILQGEEIYEFLMIAFGSAALAASAFFIKRIFAHESVSHLKNKVFGILAACAAVTTAMGNVIAFRLANRVPAVIQFPIVNGGSVIVTSILSVIIFRDRLSCRMVVGLMIGIFALVMVSSG